jgi:hypothetical protein
VLFMNLVPDLRAKKSALWGDAEWVKGFDAVLGSVLQVFIPRRSPCSPGEQRPGRQSCRANPLPAEAGCARRRVACWRDRARTVNWTATHAYQFQALLACLGTRTPQSRPGLPGVTVAAS